jgi:integrase
MKQNCPFVSKLLYSTGDKLPEYKYGKQTKPIDFTTFKEMMKKLEPSPKPLRDKSLLAFLYWFGVRRAEALERVKKDFTIKDGRLIVEAAPKKRGKRPPLEIDTDLPYVELIMKQVEKTKPGCRVWPISSTTAWRIVKRVSEKHYPHFFRLNRATKFLDDPSTTIPEMKAWFGWKTTKTIDDYVGYSRRHIRRQSSRLRREVKES